MTDDHHQRVHAGKGVWHSVGSGRREGEGHSIETELEGPGRYIHVHV